MGFVDTRAPVDESLSVRCRYPSLTETSADDVLTLSMLLPLNHELAQAFELSESPLNSSSKTNVHGPSGPFG